MQAGDAHNLEHFPIPRSLTDLIDRLLASKPRVLLALDGGSCSGKTTLAEGLASRYSDSAIFHMDDFFLRPEQRTPERYREPGGNVDRERFLEEVLLPLSRGNPVAYRPFDCRTMTLKPALQRLPGRLNIIEGAYSLHHDLADYYDASVFLAVSPALQLQRLEARNTPEAARQFKSRWIPLEQAYFDAMQPQSRCTLVLEVT